MMLLRHLQTRYGVDVAAKAVIITFYASQAEVCIKRSTRINGLAFSVKQS